MKLNWHKLHDVLPRGTDGEKILAVVRDYVNEYEIELQKWRSVFGHLGATPNDCGNVLYAKFGQYEARIAYLEDLLK